ncbi:DNA-packaging protein [Chitinophaga sp. sic0106]|uniref:DNA-packaging protein n=1 Tax=Chitinophaga sp. sic0106 TaxID=2854785 RepID=UPI001C467F33|nr:DNA-packaging protein [Chitinophaga sp. sic0106]MBV7534062.1 DNA-packaging protein [Chitinophaga sp. sic0106]
MSGSKPRFEPVELQSLWEEYKRDCNNHRVEEVSAGKVVKLLRPRVYTLEEFQARLPLSRQAWSEYCKRERYEAICETISFEVEARKRAALVNGGGSTTGLIFDLKCNYGWQDKQVVEQTVQINSVDVRLLPAINNAPIASSEKDVDV